MLARLRYSDFMATLTIRNLDETVKRRLQVRAALNGRSMEAEAREALSKLVVSNPISAEPEEDLGTAIRKRFAPFGGVELEIPPRQFPQDRSRPLTDDPARHKRHLRDHAARSGAGRDRLGSITPKERVLDIFGCCGRIAFRD